MFCTSWFFFPLRCPEAPGDDASFISPGLDTPMRPLSVAAVFVFAFQGSSQQKTYGINKASSDSTDWRDPLSKFLKLPTSAESQDPLSWCLCSGLNHPDWADGSGVGPATHVVDLLTLLTLDFHNQSTFERKGSREPGVAWKFYEEEYASLNTLVLVLGEKVEMVGRLVIVLDGWLPFTKTSQRFLRRWKESTFDRTKDTKPRSQKLRVFCWVLTFFLILSSNPSFFWCCVLCCGVFW